MIFLGNSLFDSDKTPTNHYTHKKTRMDQLDIGIINLLRTIFTLE